MKSQYHWMKNLSLRIALMGALVPSTGALGWAGACGGARSAFELVEARSTDVFDVCFRGNQMAHIAVSGDGDTDLDLYVYNAAGQLVAKDDDYTDECRVSWFAQSTATYTIRVVNRGRIPNEYQLTTN